MDIGTIIFGVVFVGVGIVFLVGSGKKLRQWRDISTNDPVDIRDATTEPDLVEIEGRVRPHEATLESPHFGEECVAYEYKTEKKHDADRVTRSHERSGKQSILARHLVRLLSKTSRELRTSTHRARRCHLQ